MKYKINKGTIVEKINGEVVLFDSDKSIFFTLNSTASYIFEKMKRGFTKDKIIELMMKKYKIDKKTITNDFEEIIEKMLKKRIILPSNLKK